MYFRQTDIYFVISVIFCYFPVNSQNSVPSSSSPTPNTATSVQGAEASHDVNKPSITSITTNIDSSSPNLWENREMFVRALIIIACVSLIAVAYLLVRCLRHKHQMNKGRKYGLITSQEDKMELHPLDQAEEEDDLTIFDGTTGKPRGQYDFTRNVMKLKDKAP